MSPADCGCENWTFDTRSTDRDKGGRVTSGVIDRRRTNISSSQSRLNFDRMKQCYKAGQASIPPSYFSLPPQPNPVVPPSTINKQRKQEPEHKTFISGKIGSAFLWDCAPSNPLSLPSSLHRRGPNPAGTMTPAALGTRTHKHKHGTGLDLEPEWSGMELGCREECPQ